MKKLILIFTILFSTNVFASNWVAGSKLKNPIKVWTKKGRCESQESEQCFEITGKDLRRFKVGFKAIDVDQTRDCNNSTDCQAKLDGLEPEFGCGEFETPSFDDKANWPSLDFSPRPANGWFLWCQKQIVVADPAGSAIADTEDTQKAAEKSTRESAKTQRKASLDQCVADSKSGTLTLPQASACIRALVREIKGDSVPVSDL